jgi:hypothetical protein
MGTTNRKLPRGPSAARPRPGETVRKQGGADLQNGWLGRHGTLYLADERLVFVPTVLDTLLRAKRREMPLDEIIEVERSPSSPDGAIPGGQRPRMIIHTEECAYEFMVGDLDAWIDALEIVYAHRNKNGQPHQPVVVRTGSTTAMLREL